MEGIPQTITTIQNAIRAFDKNHYVGKRVVITGGTKGIVAAVANRLESLGSRVSTAGRSAPETSSGLFLQADDITPDGVRALAKSAPELLGGVDIVVNNIGGSSLRSGGLLAFTDEDWQADLNANLLAAVRLDRALLPSMIEQGTRIIIHVSSIQRRMPLNSMIAYAAAKAALSKYSKALANEVGPKGIRVNTIAPSFVETAAASRLIEGIAEKSGPSTRAPVRRHPPLRARLKPCDEREVRPRATGSSVTSRLELQLCSLCHLTVLFDCDYLELV